jgi:hypothetical protein
VALRRSIAPGSGTAYAAAVFRHRRTDRATRRGTSMKKLLVILILAAIGIAVAKKVREA